MPEARPSHPPLDHAVAIIGAGFGGIIAALQLLRSGRRDFVILERADRLGGTWRDNTYPGCACDVPSYVYSIHGEPNPGWSRFYSGQAEILAYMQEVVHRHGLEAHIRYGFDVLRAEFDAAAGAWALADRAGRRLRVKAVIAALGPLNRPVWPDIPGRERFAGAAFHSGQWDHAFDLRGKRVAVIGTGASAVQVVPAIAPLVARLEVFQRTAAWIAPRRDHPVPERQRRRYARFPFLLRLYRRVIWEVMELRGRSMVGNAFIHGILRRMSLRKLAREVHDPETRRRLTPGYKLGCKRILTSDDYLPAFNQAHVHLVTEPIAEIVAEGLRTADGRLHAVDVLICCTGFEAAEFTTDMEVVGLGGRSLFGEWKGHSMEAHRGTTFSGFPNLLYVLGPNTGLGHHSVLLMMEAQMPYILQYLAKVDALGPEGYLDVLPAAQQRSNADLQARFAGTVWGSGCNSWYMDSKGRNTTLYPRLVRDFQRSMARLDVESYAEFPKG